MSRMTKALPLALTAALLAACSANNGSGENAKPSGSALPSGSGNDTASATADDNPYKEKVKFTINLLDADKMGKLEDGSPAPDFEWLKQKFNVDFEFIPVTWDDYAVEKPRLWMASDQMPDLMMVDIAGPRYPMFMQWVKSDMLMPYPEFGDKYPNLQKVWDGFTNGKKFEVDGKVYAWPAYMDTAKYNFLTPNAYLYRKDWADSVGLRKSANADLDEYTWDEWQALVKAVTEKDPGGNGQGGTIGIMAKDWIFPRFVGTQSYSPDFLRFTRGTDGKWAWGAALPETWDLVQATKKLYDDGLVWKDQIIVKAEDPNNFMVAGKLFAQSTGGVTVGGVQEIVDAWQKANPGKDPSQAFGLAVVKSPDGAVHTEQASDHWTETLMNPKLTDAQRDRWLAILDWLVSDEGYNFRTYGIPGQDWDYKDDGTVEVKWPKDENGNYVSPLYDSGRWPLLSRAGNTDAFALENPSYPEWERNSVKAVYERMMQPDVKVTPIDVDVTYFTAPNFDKVGVMERETYQEIAKVMVSKNPKEEWDKYVKEGMKKVQPVLDELNEQLP